MPTWPDGPATLTVGRDPAPLPLPLEVASSFARRSRGLLGRDGLPGALLLTPAQGVHTLGMRFAIDVAYLDRRLTVLAVRTMPPGRVGRPRLRARHVLEAEAGAFARWGIRPGVRVAVAVGAAAAAEPDPQGEAEERGKREEREGREGRAE